VITNAQFPFQEIEYAFARVIVSLSKEIATYVGRGFARCNGGKLSACLFTDRETKLGFVLVPNLDKRMESQ